MMKNFWVARDKDGTLILYKGKPVRGSLDKDKWVSFGVHWENFEIDSSLFPDLKWEDEPVEVKLTKVDRHYIQCDNCDRAFSFQSNEIISGTFQPQPSSGYEEEYEYVICPYCRGKVYL